jgi:hypothetical protein
MADLKVNHLTGHDPTTNRFAAVQVAIVIGGDLIPASV